MNSNGVVYRCNKSCPIGKRCFILKTAVTLSPTGTTMAIDESLSNAVLFLCNGPLARYPQLSVFNRTDTSHCDVIEIRHIDRSLLLSLLNSNEIPAFKMGKIRKIYKQNLIRCMSQYQ